MMKILVIGIELGNIVLEKGETNKRYYY